MRFQLIFGFEDAAPLTRSSGGDIAQRGLQIGVALARADRLALAGTFVVARTGAAPGREMTVAGEDRHIDADLRDHGGRHHPIDAGDGHQQGQLRRIGCQPVADQPVEGRRCRPRPARTGRAASPRCRAGARPIRLPGRRSPDRASGAACHGRACSSRPHRGRPRSGRAGWPAPRPRRCR
jgi:hypothetical protein